MKKVLVLVFLALCLAACGSSNIDVPELNGKWQATKAEKYGKWKEIKNYMIVEFDTKNSKAIIMPDDPEIQKDPELQKIWKAICKLEVIKEKKVNSSEDVYHIKTTQLKDGKMILDGLVTIKSDKSIVFQENSSGNKVLFVKI